MKICILKFLGFMVILLLLGAHSGPPPKVLRERIDSLKQNNSQIVEWQTKPNGGAIATVRNNQTLRKIYFSPEEVKLMYDHQYNFSIDKKIKRSVIFNHTGNPGKGAAKHE